MSQTQRYYPGVITRDRPTAGSPDASDRRRASQTLGVWFPDFDGCVTVGHTLDEAYSKALEVLQFHIDGMVEDGDAVPPPSWASVERLAVDDDESILVAIIGVPVSVPTRAKRVNVTIEENLLERVDERAAELGLPRSTFLAEAARQALGVADADASPLEAPSSNPRVMQNKAKSGGRGR